VTNAIKTSRVTFKRRAELPGVEIRCVENSSQAFRHYNADFEFFVTRSWRGQLWHRQRELNIEPGTIVCAQPGEVTLARRVLEAGDFRALCIDEATLLAYLAELGVPPERGRLRAWAPLSPQVDSTLQGVFAAVDDGSATQANDALRAFIRCVADELLDPVGMRSVTDFRERTARRVRESLGDESAVPLDLTTLAQQAGVSRFQALRAFKRRYGLPPHTYQLQVRVGLAKKSLREGQQPARVAVDCGFVDQSHLTRHFKRLLGVTPAQYARVGTA
jgi:AraC-like DNA-binding protein